MARRSLGRQRVEMVKMENENNLQVTFSKRRACLFKKASELCTLYDIDVAIVVFSPGNKVFSFGHPSLEAVVEKFLAQGIPPPPPPVNEGGGVAAPTEQLIEAHRNARVNELNMELMRLEALMEAEQKRNEQIDEVVKANREAQGWMRVSLDELNLEQFAALKNGMENLMADIYQKAHRLLGMPGNDDYPNNPFPGGGVNAFPTGNMPAVGALSFGTGGGAAAAGALPLSGVAAAAPTPALPVNTFMPSGYNVFNQGDASNSGASRSGGNLGIPRQFF